jgi:hypothetical protein
MVDPEKREKHTAAGWSILVEQRIIIDGRRQYDTSLTLQHTEP